MIEPLLLLTIAASVYALAAKDLLYGVIALSASSVFCAWLFYILHAPDVAITEAAVGAGVSTLIYVWVIKKTERRDSQ